MNTLRYETWYGNTIVISPGWVFRHGRDIRKRAVAIVAADGKVVAVQQSNIFVAIAVEVTD